MAHINPILPAVGDTNWGLPLNSAINTLVTQVNSQDDIIVALPTTYATIGSGGSGGSGGSVSVTGSLTASDNGNGTTAVTVTGTGYTLVDNGDGTSTVIGPTVSDNANGTSSVTSGSATSSTGGTGSAPPTTRSLTGTTYTLVLTDANNIVENSGSSTLTITVPTAASVAYPVGTVVEFFNYSTGSITIVPASGVTLRSPNGLRMIAQYASAAMRKRATDEWVVAGYTSV